MTSFHVGLIIVGALVVEIVYLTLADRGPIIWLLKKKR
jgi:hypothetical protein